MKGGFQTPTRNQKGRREFFSCDVSGDRMGGSAPRESRALPGSYDRPVRRRDAVTRGAGRRK